MSKSIPENEDYYIAPGILGFYEEGVPVALDESSDQRLDPENIDDKIKIYEREVSGWFLNKAEAILQDHSTQYGFVALMICISYFEGVEQYKTGISSHGKSGDFFANSVRRLYGDKFKKDEIDFLYSSARCGLFHNGMIKGQIVLNCDFQDSIKIDEITHLRKTKGKKEKKFACHINPRKMLEDIKEDFCAFVRELRDENNKILRENFDRMFEIL
ncbi:hypothetical protein [Nodosilinea sp. FACHB-13]|uniref:hypothetical protein n=1 Tax=Cyanophyceae TaxID=3028117 RepID=UPI001A7E90BB|nr:hypothetical protein [Nodosilinea sp. FACHB-13]